MHETLTENWSDESSLSPLNVTNDDSIGDPFPDTKGPGITRLYFSNINGISYGPMGGEFIGVCATMKELGIDILGIAETKLDTARRYVVTSLKKCATRSFATSHHRLVTASSSISYDSSAKPGGTLLMTHGHTVGRIVSSSSDEMGRWCTTTYAGRNGKLITVISAYQVVDAPVTSSTENGNTTEKTTAAIQQYAMMLQKNLPTTRHPRGQFIIDLKALLEKLRSEQHSVILMGDFNEVFDKDPEKLSHAAAAGGLVDLMDSRLGHTSFNTHIRGSDRIDYVLVSPCIAQACVAAGYDAFKARFTKSDHRGFFLDLKTSILFGNETPALANPSQRILNSKHERNRRQYIDKRWQFLKQRRWLERLDIADEDLLPPSELHEHLEKLDRDWVQSAIYAEKSCIRHKSPRYVRRLAELRKLKQVLEISISAQRWGCDLNTAMEIARQKYPLDIPDSLDEQCKLLYQTKRDMKKIEKNADVHRRQEQEADIAARKAAGELVGAKAIRNIMIAEEMKQMWRQLRSLTHQGDQGVSRVQIPRNNNFTTCKECTDWVNVDTPEEIEAALLRRNQVHFGQAHGTFPTIPPFSEKLDWTAGTYEAELILEGEPDEAFPPHEIDEISALFLRHFEKTTSLDSITAELTEDEWEGKMKVWSEATTTSPSGMHLGHHKSLIKPITTPEHDRANSEAVEANRVLESKRGDLLTAQVKLVNLAIRHGHVYERWKSVSNFMIHKEPGNTKIHRLRVIHLYEADLNLILGVKWRQLAHHGIDNDLFDPYQFGGLPGRDALTPAFIEELQWEISRASRRPLLRQDFDAASCYDRIVPSIASLAGRSFGQHKTLCFVHATLLSEAKYLLKTKLGISKEHFKHCRLFPIFGTGQGSANSPVIWVLISTRLFQAYASKAHGATFQSPDGKFMVRVFMIGFVDDSNNCVNDFCNDTPSAQALLEKAQHDAQLWNDLLDRSGGALELSKCVFHLAHYTFSGMGAPVLEDNSRSPAMSIEVTNTKGVTKPFKHVSSRVARKSLGCFKSPSGTRTQTLKAITRNVNKHINNILRGSLDAVSARRHMVSIMQPSVTYSFPVNNQWEQALTDLSNKAYRKYLPLLGYNRNMPHAVVYAPREWGGVDCRPFYDIQGAAQVAIFLKHWRTPSDAQTHLQIALSWFQKLSGIGKPILEYPSIPLPHLDDESKYIASLRQFLHKVKGSMVIEDDLAMPLQRENDQYLMQLVIDSNIFSRQDIMAFSYCQHFLQVYTVSDIAEGCGLKVDPQLLQGRKGRSTSRDMPILQDKPSAAAFAVWKRAQTLWCFPSTQCLRQPLGKWLHQESDLRRDWPILYSPSADTLYQHSITSAEAHTFQSHALVAGSTEVFQLTSPMQTLHRDQLPDDVYPMGAHIDNSTLQMTGTRGVVPGDDTAEPAATFQQFLEQQDPWIRLLLEHLDFKIAPARLAAMLASAPCRQPFLSACDGSVIFQTHGTFGWVLATPDEVILVQCSGPAFGMPMDSYRAESHGKLSHIIFLRLLQLYHNTACPRVSLVCDNKALVDRAKLLRQSRRPLFPNDTLQPSWDTVQAIQRYLKLMPLVKISWIKGHQDDVKDLSKLTPEARLNIKADKLAGAFQYRWDTVEKPTCVMIENTKCHFRIGDEAITSRQFRQALDVRRTENIKSYLQDKYKWNRLSMVTIEWGAYTHAIRNWCPPNQVDSRSSTFLPKFLVGWLPVGKRVSRYNARMYSQHCPSCPDNVVEDSSHLLQCPNRSDWQKQMFDELKRKCRKLDTDPNLFKLLATALNCWLNLAPFPAENFRYAYQSLISSQSQIGWQHLFYGRWSREWDMCQTRYLDFKGTPHTPFNNGQAWASKLIRIIWKHCHEAWTDRNLARHGKDEAHQKEIALAEAKAKIRSLYELRPQCRLQKQHNWFHASPETHFETEPSLRQLNQWIKSYGIMIQAVARRQRVLDELGQRGIDEAFELISHH